jgi:hypothetical protein
MGEEPVKSYRSHESKKIEEKTVYIIITPGKDVAEGEYFDNDVIFQVVPIGAD